MIPHWQPSILIQFLPDINTVPSCDMEIPDLSALENVYDASDETSMNEFAATLNLEPVLNNLLTAGMPEDSSFLRYGNPGFICSGKRI